MHRLSQIQLWAIIIHTRKHFFFPFQNLNNSSTLLKNDVVWITINVPAVCPIKTQTLIIKFNQLTTGSWQTRQLVPHTEVLLDTVAPNPLCPAYLPGTTLPTGPIINLHVSYWSGAQLCHFSIGWPCARGLCFFVPLSGQQQGSCRVGGGTQPKKRPGWRG